MPSLVGSEMCIRDRVYVGSFYPRLPESGPGPLRSAPSLRKQAALDGIGSRNIYFEYIFSSSSLIIQTIYMGFSTGVYFSSTKISACSPTCRGDLSLLVLIVQRAQHAARPAGELSFPVVQIVQHTAPLVGESFSPGTTELNFQPHQSDMRSSLQQLSLIHI